MTKFDPGYDPAVLLPPCPVERLKEFETFPGFAPVAAVATRSRRSSARSFAVPRASSAGRPRTGSLPDRNGAEPGAAPDPALGAEPGR